MTYSHKFYLSTEAWSTLLDNARARNYLSKTAVYRSVNLHKYLEWLCTQEFHDARPKEIQASDIPRMATGRMPYWSLEDERFPHRIVMSAQTQRAYLDLATKFLISNHRRVDGPMLTTSQISAVLEAIGIGWLRSV